MVLDKIIYTYKMRTKVEADKNILDIRTKTLSKIQTCLDTNQKWRDVVASASKSKQFLLKDYDIEEVGIAVLTVGGSPSEKLLRKFGMRGMTVNDLALILDELHLEKALTNIRAPEELVIIAQPQVTITVQEGQVLELQCKAKGFPYPKYVWFRDNEDASETHDHGNYRKEHVTLADAGIYVCRVHNKTVLNKKEDPKFSRQCQVIVEPSMVGRAQPVPSAGGVPGQSGLVCKRQPGDFFVPRITVHPCHTRVILRGSACLVCQAEGNPPPRYQWHRNGTPLTSTNDGRLYLPQVAMTDAGVYTCRINNAIGSVVSMQVRLMVFTPNQELEMSQPFVIEDIQDQGVVLGSSVKFKVKASGDEPLHYEWFHNGVNIPGVHTPHLQLQITSISRQGKYKCLVRNSSGSVFSREVTLTVDMPKYTAQDKVALLIGNAQYRSQHPLPAVEHDIAQALIQFRKLNFKVYAYLDMTLHEMEQALEYFCQLIEQGVYAVVYFAGHGFSQDGQHYLIPWDAKHGLLNIAECICAEYIEKKVQDRCPALLFMILDICRREKDCCDKHSISEAPTRHQPKVSGNSCIWYATSYGQKAFEEAQNERDPTQLPRGRFSRHLIKVLNMNKPLYDLYPEFRKEFNKDSYPQDQFPQDPEFKTNIRDLGRSLFDRIEQPYTKAMDVRTKRFEKAHVIPVNQRMSVEEFKIDVRMLTKVYMSNVLELSWQVMRNVPGMKCQIQIDHDSLPAALVITRRFTEMARIHNIQRLHEDLTVNVKLTLFYTGCPAARREAHVPLNLGRPLVSALSGWKSYHMTHPEEQTEDSKHVRFPTEQVEEPGSSLESSSSSESAKKDDAQPVSVDNAVESESET